MMSNLEKLTGKPHNLTAGDAIGAGTEAAGRPAINSSISGGKFTCAPTGYGTEGVGGSGNGSGKGRQHGVRGFAAGQTNATPNPNPGRSVGQGNRHSNISSTSGD